MLNKAQTIIRNEVLRCVPCAVADIINRLGNRIEINSQWTEYPAADTPISIPFESVKRMMRQLQFIQRHVQDQDDAIRQWEASAWEAEAQLGDD